MHRSNWVTAIGALASLVLAGCERDQTTQAATSAEPAPTALQADKVRSDRDQDLDRLQHIVVIYLENHSFDNLYGEFAGANGLANAGATSTQVDGTGTPFATLPMTATSPFPANLPNAPFNIEQYVPASMKIPDLVHRFYQEQAQIDGGRMDKFALVSDAKGETMGFYHTAGLPLAAEAARYTLCDNFFHAAFGGSFLNHFWLIAAQTPVFPNAPAAVVAVLDASGNLVTDGFVTPDGYAVNTAYSVNTPHPSTVPAERLVPNQTFPTIGDRLSARRISWVWYAGGWNDALAGHPDPLFQFHHQPFVFFYNYRDGTTAKAAHLRDETEFFTAAQSGKLPAVSFVKPLGPDNEHPGYADMVTGEQHTLDLINAVRNGPDWKNSVIIITYDEHGGFWDHVAPPVVDRWGPGSRVPTLIISPFARRGYVDHHRYDTTSILALIEHRWHLEPLSDRDAAAEDLSAALDFRGDRWEQGHDGH
ncbi:MAG TPA: acid phosphatase [Gemmatimonadales bacterium]|nr:acid phosphatase [Gemmatimonadales bacterium]